MEYLVLDEIEELGLHVDDTITLTQTSEWSIGERILKMYHFRKGNRTIIMTEAEVILYLSTMETKVKHIRTDFYYELDCACGKGRFWDTTELINGQIIKCQSCGRQHTVELTSLE